MAIIFQRFASLQPTPTTPKPGQLPMRVPVEPRAATSLDQVPRSAQERLEPNARAQGGQHSGKQREGEPPRPGN